MFSSSASRQAVLVRIGVGGILRNGDRDRVGIARKRAVRDDELHDIKARNVDLERRVDERLADQLGRAASGRDTIDHR